MYIHIIYIFCSLNIQNMNYNSSQLAQAVVSMQVQIALKSIRNPTNLGCFDNKRIAAMIHYGSMVPRSLRGPSIGPPLCPAPWACREANIKRIYFVRKTQKIVLKVHVEDTRFFPIRDECHHQVLSTSVGPDLINSLPFSSCCHH